MKQKLFIFSIVGWVLCILIPILTFININLLTVTPFLWCLFPGIFIVFIPSIIYAKNNSRIIEYDYDNNNFLQSNSVSLIPFFEKAPSWIITILIMSFLSTIVSFSKLINLDAGTPSIINNEFVLEYRGKIIKQITKSEFNELKLLNVRYFFGFIPLFYAVCILVLNKLIEWDKIDQNE